eukprot:CAMPEP_0113691028 /NCGR_PEP_ID=MMETSP0038_2-20120614/18171_1 /TAXON_ID=2898 /ORGANISM="Cryptomonas paramecium" /LENGTH=146 /DNA_ID=CAMNT_0000612523 /DNA_START=260 /DNA_END=697 /DNA_ORIENTATION=- /assembly_acc=CAM_ASM_000170
MVDLESGNVRSASPENKYGVVVLDNNEVEDVASSGDPHTYLPFIDSWWPYPSAVGSKWRRDPSVKAQRRNFMESPASAEFRRHMQSFKKYIADSEDTYAAALRIYKMYPDEGADLGVDPKELAGLVPPAKDDDAAAAGPDGGGDNA